MKRPRPMAAMIVELETTIAQTHATLTRMEETVLLTPEPLQRLTGWDQIRAMLRTVDHLRTQAALLTSGLKSAPTPDFQDP